MPSIAHKIERGLSIRQANYLNGVPDSLKRGYNKPGSRNRKRSYQSSSTGNRSNRKRRNSR